MVAVTVAVKENEAAVVMGTVDVVDDDGAAELSKVQAYTCVSKSSKTSCQLNDGRP